MSLDVHQRTKEINGEDPKEVKAKIEDSINAIESHYKKQIIREKLLTLQNINIGNDSLTKNDILPIFKLFADCPILGKFCMMQEHDLKGVDFDYEYELQQKKNAIENLKRQINELKSDIALLKITEKPNDFEPDIFKACVDGKLESVKWLIEKESKNKNDRNLHGRCLIHLAAIHGHFLIIKYLISIGAEIDYQDNKGNQAIHFASKYGHCQIVEYLISKGAKPDAKNNRGDQAIHFASKGGSLSVLQYFIDQLHIDKNVTGDNGKAPIHFACRHCHLPVINYLVSLGTDVNVQDKFGFTPLHSACFHGHLQLAEFLISKGGNIEAKSNVKKTPLHIACIDNQYQIIEYLLSIGANIDAKDYYYKTPLHYACEYGHLQLANYLISKGADIDAKDREGNYVIHIAVIGNLLPIVQYLIEKQNVDVNIKGYEDKTPLHYACESGYIQIAEYLIYKGAKIYCTDINDDSEIHLASKRGHLQMVQYLIEKQNIDVNTKGYEKRTPLHYACEKGYLQIVEYLISKGANIEEKDIDGNTPLHIANLNFINDEISKFLISHGANKDALNNHNMKPSEMRYLFE